MVLICFSLMISDIKHLLYVFWPLRIIFGDLSTQVLLPRELPGGPVVRTLCFHCRGHGFDPWSRNLDPACRAAQPKKKDWKSSPFAHFLNQVI